MDHPLLHYRGQRVKKAPNRLINIHTLAIEEVTGYAPPYAVLSHRWADEELSYETYNDPDTPTKLGYIKVKNFCRYIKALNCGRPDGGQDYTGPLVQHVWVDMCCIDKRSSAELSEAINSMASWYQYSCFCVAYLADVTSAAEDDWAAFRASEWFQRGWTLQELIFPPTVAFCDRDWKQFLWMSPVRTANLVLVSQISGVPMQCLRNSRSIFEQSIASRMSWAAKRKTTRKEDEAYCLLGLLDINMPLIYGEGERAFTRLQEEIIRRNSDESIFAWTATGSDNRIYPLLAASPAQFAECGDVTCRQIGSRIPYTITNQGLELRTESVRFRLTSGTTKESTRQRDIFIIQLNCCYTHQGKAEACLIALIKREAGEDFRRLYAFRGVWQSLTDLTDARHVTLEPTRVFHVALLPYSGRSFHHVMNELTSGTIQTLKERVEQLIKLDDQPSELKQHYDQL